MDRDELGRLVRETWVKYCLETGDTKPSHIAPYDELSEWDKEADRRIGEAIKQAVLAHKDALTTIFGMPVVVDKSLPEGTIALRPVCREHTWAGGVNGFLGRFCKKCGISYPG